MDRLWAPWRTKYIQKIHRIKKCIFCKRNSKKDKNEFVIKRNTHCFAILNLYPYNNGHVLIAPYRHLSDLELLHKEEISDIMDLVKETISVLKKILKPSGFNVGINLGRCAGAGFTEHMHIHIVPRWNGDANFMPVISSTKVISESLEELFNKVKVEYDKKRRARD